MTMAENEQEIKNGNLTLKVKYLTDIPPLEFVEGKSDWIDLRSGRDVFLKYGEFVLIPFGVCIKLPEGYEAHIAPRSSTFKNWGLIQTNSVGVVDESYCGETDEWKMPVLCMVNSSFIKKGERIAQFRIMPKMKNIQFETVEHMTDKSRGGFGSTGTE